MLAPVVILVRPQMGENIGAVARAMSNFGLSELRLAAPRDGWPNPKASEMAAGAEPIVANAKIYADLPSAMAGIQLAYATTARPRDMEKRVLEPAPAAMDMAAQQAGGRRCAFIFGPERSGLTNHDISWCDTLVSIPTAPENTSLNIAQSSVILFYEWWRAQGGRIEAPALSEIAPKEDWLGLFTQLESYLDTSDYFRIPERKAIMWQNLQNLLLRGQWSVQELRSLRGVLRALWERRRG